MQLFESALSDLDYLPLSVMTAGSPLLVPWCVVSFDGVLSRSTVPWLLVWLCSTATCRCNSCTCSNNVSSNLDRTASTALSRSTSPSSSTWTSWSSRLEHLSSSEFPLSTDFASSAWISSYSWRCSSSNRSASLHFRPSASASSDSHLSFTNHSFSF